jgi:hypothetical protein
MTSLMTRGCKSAHRIYRGCAVVILVYRARCHPSLCASLRIAAQQLRFDTIRIDFFSSLSHPPSTWYAIEEGQSTCARCVRSRMVAAATAGARVFGVVESRRTAHPPPAMRPLTMSAPVVVLVVCTVCQRCRLEGLPSRRCRVDGVDPRLGSAGEQLQAAQEGRERGDEDAQPRYHRVDHPRSRYGAARHLVALAAIVRG